jgi:hypothetical protein
MLELSPPLPVLFLLRVGGLSRLNTLALTVCFLLFSQVAVVSLNSLNRLIYIAKT